MTVRNVTEAKAQLSALLELVEQGEEVVISRGNKPVAKLTAYQPEKKRRRLGTWKGLVKIADDFNEWTPELDEMFYGKDK